MNYAVELGSGAMIYISSFMKTCYGVQTLLGFVYTYRQQGDLISLLLFFQNKESRIKTLKKSSLLCNLLSAVSEMKPELKYR
jgi:hypothetical protein